jgi:uncharacterized protein YgiM (DUF1202 family)
VLGEAEDGWIPVRCGEQDGYVSDQYLTLEPAGTPAAVVTPESETIVLLVTDGDLASCRLEPNTESLVIADLDTGDEVILAGEVTGGWTPVTCEGLEGWVFADYLEVPMSD